MAVLCPPEQGRGAQEAPLHSEWPCQLSLAWDFQGRRGHHSGAPPKAPQPALNLLFISTFHRVQNVATGGFVMGDPVTRVLTHSGSPRGEGNGHGQTWLQVSLW